MLNCKKFYIDNNEAGELLELDNQFHKELLCDHE